MPLTACKPLSSRGSSAAPTTGVPANVASRSSPRQLLSSGWSRRSSTSCRSSGASEIETCCHVSSAIGGRHAGGDIGRLTGSTDGRSIPPRSGQARRPRIAVRSCVSELHRLVRVALPGKRSHRRPLTRLSIMPWVPSTCEAVQHFAPGGASLGRWTRGAPRGCRSLPETRSPGGTTLDPLGRAGSWELLSYSTTNHRRHRCCARRQRPTLVKWGGKGGRRRKANGRTSAVLSRLRCFLGDNPPPPPLTPKPGAHRAIGGASPLGTATRVRQGAQQTVAQLKWLSHEHIAASRSPAGHRYRACGSLVEVLTTRSHVGAPGPTASTTRDAAAGGEPWTWRSNHDLHRRVAQRVHEAFRAAVSQPRLPTSAALAAI